MPDLYSGPPKRAPQAPPSIAGSINPNMFAGESQAMERMGSAIQGVGDQFHDFLMRRRYADYANQVNDGILAEQQFNSKYEKQNAGDTDFETQSQRYDQAHKQWEEDYSPKVKSSKAKTRLKTSFALSRDEKELEIFIDARKKIIQKLQLDQPRLRADSAKKYANIYNDDEAVASLAKKHLADTYFADVQEREDKGMFPPGYTEAEKREFAMAVAMEGLERSPEITQKVIESGDFGVLMSDDLAGQLISEDKDEIRAAARRKSSHRQILWNQDEETKKAEYQMEAAAIAETGDAKAVNDYLKTKFNDRVLFSDRSTVQDWRYNVLGKADRAQNIIKEGKPNPYTTVSDPAKYWTNYTKVLKDPNSMTEAEITAMVPNVCGITQAQSILNLKKTKDDDPLKSPQAEKYLKALEVLHTDKDKVLDVKTWDRQNRQLIEHIKNNPKDTPNQLYEFYKQLAEPQIESRWKKVLGWLSDLAVGDMRELGKATKGKGELTEPKNVGEFEFEVQRISQSDKKAAREYYDKWAGKW